MDDTKIDFQDLEFQQEMLGIFESGIKWDPATGEIITSPLENSQVIIENLAKEVISQKAFIEQLKTQIETWKARILRAEARIEKAKIMIDAILPEGEKVSRPDLGISVYRMKSEATIVDDPEALPEQFITVKTYRNPNLSLIKAALKEGVQLPAHIQNNSSVVVKGLF